MTPASIRSVVQLAMSPLLGPEETAKVSSKSWRELPVTLPFLSGLNATEVCALGNWLDASSQGSNVTPWRYHRAKQQQACSLKHRLRFVLKEVILDQAWHTWEDVDESVLRSAMARSVEPAAALWRGPHKLRLMSRRARRRPAGPLKRVPEPRRPSG